MKSTSLSWRWNSLPGFFSSAFLFSLGYWFGFIRLLVKAIYLLTGFSLVIVYPILDTLLLAALVVVLHHKLSFFAKPLGILDQHVKALLKSEKSHFLEKNLVSFIQEFPLLSFSLYLFACLSVKPVLFCMYLNVQFYQVHTMLTFIVLVLYGLVKHYRIIFGNFEEFFPALLLAGENVKKEVIKIIVEKSGVSSKVAEAIVKNGPELGGIVTAVVGTTVGIGMVDRQHTNEDVLRLKTDVRESEEKVKGKTPGESDSCDFEERDFLQEALNVKVSRQNDLDKTDSRIVAGLNAIGREVKGVLPWPSSDPRHLAYEKYNACRDEKSRPKLPVGDLDVSDKVPQGDKSPSKSPGSDSNESSTSSGDQPLVSQAPQAKDSGTGRIWLGWLQGGGDTLSPGTPDERGSQSEPDKGDEPKAL
jgi:hypothetical protein